MWQFGLAEVEVRVRPVQQKEVEWYVRRELKPGTEVDYLEGQVARARRHARKPIIRVVKEVVRALLEAFRRPPSSGPSPNVPMGGF